MDNQLVFVTSQDINEIPQVGDRLGVVYVIENEIGNVKIGRTIKPKTRLASIESTSGIKITRFFISPPCSNYNKLELITHAKYKHRRVLGEWFDVAFDDVCDFIKKLEFNTTPRPKKNFDILTKEIATIIGPYISPKEREYHCDYCNCPVEYWDPLESYPNDRSCELYSDFSDIVCDFENRKETFDFQDIISKMNELKNNYHDIADMKPAVKEMIEIHIDCGVMPMGLFTLDRTNL